MVGPAEVGQERVGESVRVMAVSENRFAAVLLREVLSRFWGCNVVSSLASCEEALASAARAPADVAVINEDLEGEPLKGLHLAKQLSSAFPGIKLVMKVASGTREVIVESFQSGARGIFHDGEPLDALWDCISQVHQGRIYASQTDISYLVGALVKSPPCRLRNTQGKAILTKREQQVANYATEGYTNRQIAGKLGLSHHTVKNYLFRIFEKLGISSRAEMIFYILSRRPQGSDREPIPVDSSISLKPSSLFSSSRGESNGTLVVRSKENCADQETRPLPLATGA